MKSALTRALDRKQSETTESLGSYLDSKEHKIGSAVFDLRMVIAEIWEARLKGETAELVIAELYSLERAHEALSALVEDVRHARNNMKVAAE